VHRLRTPVVALLALVSLQTGTGAQQNLPFSLFERSLDQLRVESGIPGLSVVIVYGRERWERAFGMADVERSIPARPDTPYPIGDLTQPIAATLVLRCIDRGLFEINDRIERWTTSIPEKSATVGQVLRHASSGEFDYDPERFAALTPLIELYYGRVPFRKVLANEILTRFAMLDAVPGHDMEQPATTEVAFFDDSELNRYRGVFQRLAVPYRVDIRRRATRGDYQARGINAGGGLIASALDLASFDNALDSPGALLTNSAKAAMQDRGGTNGPMGLGWFVQTYNGQKVVWHFGNIPNAYSSLMIRIAERDLTLILLANSDGLTAPFALDQGDVTASLFARLFLRQFVP
jgi:CubicO group peptidase (beta-lactamase class C family)